MFVAVYWLATIGGVCHVSYEGNRYKSPCNEREDSYSEQKWKSCCHHIYAPVEIHLQHHSWFFQGKCTSLSVTGSSLIWFFSFSHRTSSSPLIDSSRAFLYTGSKELDCSHPLTYKLLNRLHSKPRTTWNSMHLKLSTRLLSLPLQTQLSSTNPYNLVIFFPNLTFNPTHM